MVLDVISDLLESVLGSPLGLDIVAEVGAVEALLGDEGVPHLQQADGIFEEFIIGGGGECHDGDIGVLGSDLLELEVIGSEIMSPLADAMGLINDKSGDQPTLPEAMEHLLHGFTSCNLLGGDEEELGTIMGLKAIQLIHNPPPLCAIVLVGGEEDGADIDGIHGLDLILD